MRHIQDKVDKAIYVWEAIRMPTTTLALNPAHKNICTNPQISTEVYRIMYDFSGVLYHSFKLINISGVM